MTVMEDYKSMEWQDLRKLAKARGVNGRQPRDVIIATLKQQDAGGNFALEVDDDQPAPVTITGPRKANRPGPVTVSRMNSAGAPISDAARIIDRDGNMIAMVYRLGLVTGGERVELNFEANIKLVVDAFNKA